MPDTTADRLFADHQHLALAVARRMARRLPRRVDPDELFTAALCGLWQATQSFRENAGARFQSWAHTCIRRAICNWLRNPGAGGIGGSLAHKEPPHYPTGKYHVVPLFVADPSSSRALHLLECRDQIDVALRSIHDRHREVVESYYFRHETQATIARRMGRDTVRVCQLLAEARSLMRERLERETANGPLS